jgi:hypothetical protein
MTEYHETQKLTQWWLWLILLGVASIWIYGIYQQLYLGEPFGNNPMTDTGLLTKVDAQGIHSRYFPLWSTLIPWDQIGHAEIIQYGFVGYGIRFSPTYGTVYNAMGHTGLQIIKTSGNKVLIGTQQPEALRAVIARYL